MNDHGWRPLGDAEAELDDGATIRGRARFAPVVDDRHRCACPTWACTRPATQEDLLCDECRADPRCPT